MDLFADNFVLSISSQSKGLLFLLDWNEPEQPEAEQFVQ